MLLSNLLSANPKIKEDTQASPRPDYGSRYGYESKSGERVTVEGSLALATAYRCKNVISDDVAKMPFQMMRRIGGQIEQVQPDAVTRNMAYLLQVSPNEWGWTPFQFKKAFIEWLLFYGNSYVWQPMVGPRQLLILPADRTRPVFDLEGGLWYHHTFSNGKSEYIPAVEILHLLINPDSTGFMGKGVIAFARETFGCQLAARKTQSNFYSQGLNPAAYIQITGQTDEEGRKAYRKSYGDAIGGTDNAFRLAVFDSRVTKFEPVSMKPADAQFLESIDATDRDICNFFGLPEHMLNRGKESYNSNEQKYIEYLQGTLDAYLVPFEEAARIRWLSQAEQGNTYFKFIRESLLRMKAKERAEANEILIRSAQRTPNQCIEKDDVSGYPEGDLHYMTKNFAPIGTDQEANNAIPK
jgi:HK97 family phage portal protein